MQKIKLNMSAKKTSTKKWWTWGYGLQFVDDSNKTTGVLIKFKEDQIKSMLLAMQSGDLEKDNYGYYQFNMFPETGAYVKKDNNVGSNTQFEPVQLPNDQVPF